MSHRRSAAATEVDDDEKSKTLSSTMMTMDDLPITTTTISTANRKCSSVNEDSERPRRAKAEEQNTDELSSSSSSSSSSRRRKRCSPPRSLIVAIMCIALLAIVVVVLTLRVISHSQSSSPPPPPEPSSPPPKPSTNNTRLRFLKVAQGTFGFLRFPVESRQYTEDPGTIFVTNRGGGLSVFRVGTDEDDPNAVDPRPIGSGWRLGGPSVEGQDRLGDLLLVVTIGPGGGLHILNVSQASTTGEIVQIGDTINVTAPDGAGPLHVKWYVPSSSSSVLMAPSSSTASTRGQRRFALISMGWGNWVANEASYLAAVDVTDPLNAHQVAAFKTEANCIEGVMVVNDVALVGGFCAEVFQAIDLRGLLVGNEEKMESIQVLRNASFVQMVSGLWGDGNYLLLRGDNTVGESSSSEETAKEEDRIVFSGMWANPGGLASFRIHRPSATTNQSSPPHVMTQLGAFLSPLSSFVNRVHLHPDTTRVGLALLPLEHGPLESDHEGGVAIVDVRHPTNMRLLDSYRFFSSGTNRSGSGPSTLTRVYCAALHPSGRYAYAFGADTNEMRVFEIVDRWW